MWRKENIIQKKNNKSIPAKSNWEPFEFFTKFGYVVTLAKSKYEQYFGYGIIPLCYLNATLSDYSLYVFVFLKIERIK